MPTCGIALNFRPKWGKSLKCSSRQTLADPELQKRVAKFLPKFLNDVFLGLSRQNFSISPKNCHLSPKISYDFFHVLLWYFFVGRAKSVAVIDMGGPKSLLYDKFTMLSLLFQPPRGAKLHCQLRMGGHGRICSPLDPPLAINENLLL